MSTDLERALIDFISREGPTPTTELLARLKKSTGCSRASFYRELKRLEDEGAILILESVVHLCHAHFTARRLEQSHTEDAALQQAEEMMRSVESAPLKWTTDTLSRVHALWSTVALTVLKTLDGAGYVGWSPHPWFHLTNKNLEEQALTAHFADRHSFTTIIGPSGKLGEAYIDYFKDRGGLVRRVDRIPNNLEGTHLSVIEDYIIKIQLDTDLHGYLQKLFSNDIHRTEINSAEKSTLNAMRGTHTIELEKNPSKAEKILSLLLRSSVADSDDSTL
ncbi:MAG: hypothetical protein KDD64_01780 [Bdellovibrionales bacterium]|nr:hypothetical protein [Bdellovibrionales bacterium]